MCHCADDSCRQKCNQNTQHEAPCAGIARKVGQNFDQLRGINRQNCQNRTELNKHLEGLARRFKAKKMANQQQMACGGNGDELRQTFDETKKSGFQKIINFHEVSTLGR